MTVETPVDCPFCGETFSIVVDCSVDHQTYIEDCFVCCRPIQFQVFSSDDELIEIQAARE